jgi:L-seryl-tRNA(Ser) seleniumtransferase
VDKLTLAALEGTLRLYRDERAAWHEIPTLRMLRRNADELKRTGSRAVRLLRRRLPASITVALVPGSSQVGGGAMPLAELPTWLVAIRSTRHSAGELEELLRNRPVPIVARLNRGDLLLDVRTMTDDDWPLVTEALRQLAAAG